MLTQERKDTVYQIRSALEHLEDTKFMPSRIGDSGQVLCMRTESVLHEVTIDEDGSILCSTENQTLTPEELAYCVEQAIAARSGPIERCFFDDGVDGDY